MLTQHLRLILENNSAEFEKLKSIYEELTMKRKQSTSPMFDISSRFLSNDSVSSEGGKAEETQNQGKTQGETTQKQENNTKIEPKNQEEQEEYEEAHEEEEEDEEEEEFIKEEVEDENHEEEEQCDSSQLEENEESFIGESDLETIGEDF